MKRKQREKFRSTTASNTKKGLLSKSLTWLFFARKTRVSSPDSIYTIFVAEISNELSTFSKKFQRAARIYSSFNWSSPSDKNFYGLHDIEFLKPISTSSSASVHAKSRQILSTKMFGLTSPE